MNVLIACEESATVRDAFIELGHNAWSCDLLPTLGDPRNHLHGDCLWALGGDLHQFRHAIDRRTGRHPGCIKWDLMIAHPDCTYLCSSGLHWNHRTPGRAELTEKALAFVQILLDSDIDRIALENPIGCIGTRIRKASQIIQPFQFGEDASKQTCLWLKNLPLLKPTKYVEGRLIDGKRRWSNQTDSGQNKLAPSDTRWKERSKTYDGIADAMAKQWGCLRWFDKF